ncbi:MAG: ribonuclease III [Planctomycetes bacterium]|nr:ribonuclease III [Planctomycetota bacterium]
MPDALLALQQRIRHRFASLGLLEEALVHASAREPGGSCNERLEFLGDAVLGLVVAERLLFLHPNEDEGPLTRARAQVVSSPSLAHCARRWGLGALLRTGPGLSAAQLSDSVLSDATEAVIGAVYLDGGLDAARSVILAAFGPTIEASLHAAEPSWKTELQEFTQAQRQEVPEYRVLDSSGPDHDKSFLVTCHVRGIEYGRGRGSSKRRAEQAAAKRALGALLSGGEQRARVSAPPPGPLLHVVARPEWEAACAAGRYAPPSLEGEGFIHYSLPWQVLGVASARFAGQRDLVLLVLDPERVDGRLVYEDCYATTRAYPHVYAALRPEQVLEVHPFAPRDPDGFELPEALKHDLDPA